MFHNADSARALAAERQRRFEALAARNAAVRAAQSTGWRGHKAEQRRFAFRRSATRAPARA